MDPHTRNLLSGRGTLPFLIKLLSTELVDGRTLQYAFHNLQPSS